jgi:hypothetical protein
MALYSKKCNLGMKQYWFGAVRKSDDPSVAKKGVTSLEDAIRVRGLNITLIYCIS